MSTVPNRLRFYYLFLVFYAVFIVTFLQFLRWNNQDTHNNAFKALQIYKELAEKLNKESELDNSGFYKFMHVKNSKSENSFDVSVVSQCSSNHFMSVENLFAGWKGPISVAIYSEIGNIQRTLWDMARFMHCNNFRDFAMQLVVPVQASNIYIKDYKFVYDLLTEIDKSVSCNLPYISVLNGRRNYNWTSPYPVNLLRNIAKSGTSTDFILVIDIDMLPSRNVRWDFLNFVKVKGLRTEKIAYVLPAFEIPSDATLPKDKRQLIKMAEDKQARPFYVVPCKNCQNLTNYDQWLQRSAAFDVRIMYQVKWKHPWEPFFITRREAPNFDERFKQYGMNRVSQICELHVAGYIFVVLDNVFLVHKGYKTLEDFHETKNKEMESNRRVYGRFKIEIRYKYPESENFC